MIKFTTPLQEGYFGVQRFSFAPPQMSKAEALHSFLQRSHLHLPNGQGMVAQLC